MIAVRRSLATAALILIATACTGSSVTVPPSPTGAGAVPTSVAATPSTTEPAAQPDTLRIVAAVRRLVPGPWLVPGGGLEVP